MATHLNSLNAALSLSSPQSPDASWYFDGDSGEARPETDPEGDDDADAEAETEADAEGCSPLRSSAEPAAPPCVVAASSSRGESTDWTRLAAPSSNVDVFALLPPPPPPPPPPLLNS